MAKRQRPRAGQKTAEKNIISKAEAEEIVNEVTADITEKTKGRRKKKQPSVGFSLKVPKVIYDRLVETSDRTGMSMSSIMVRGAVKEMNYLDDSNI